MAQFTIAIAELGYVHYEAEKRVLSELDADVVLEHCLTEEALLACCRDAHGILVRTSAPVTRNVIAGLDRCKVISRYGVGYDNVDLAAAAEHGIMVANVPDYCIEEVSDQAVGLLLACARHIASRDRVVREGVWDVGPREPIYRIAGKVLGIIGFGRIGRAAHRKLAGFRFSRTLICDPYVDEAVIREAGGEKVDLDTVWREADYISLHAPLDETTGHMIGADQFALMKPTTIFINTARGGIVDTDALVEALKAEPGRSAGVDVYEEEPPPKDHPFFSLDNIVLSDHGAWYSEEAMVEAQEKAALNVLEALRGEVCTNLVNADVLAVLGRTDASR